MLVPGRERWTTSLTVSSRRGFRKAASRTATAISQRRSARATITPTTTATTRLPNCWKIHSGWYSHPGRSLTASNTDSSTDPTVPPSATTPPTTTTTSPARETRSQRTAGWRLSRRISASSRRGTARRHRRGGGRSRRAPCPRGGAAGAGPGARPGRRAPPGGRARPARPRSLLPLAGQSRARRSQRDRPPTAPIAGPAEHVRDLALARDDPHPFRLRTRRPGERPNDARHDATGVLRRVADVEAEEAPRVDVQGDDERLVEVSACR